MPLNVRLQSSENITGTILPVTRHEQAVVAQTRVTGTESQITVPLQANRRARHSHQQDQAWYARWSRWGALAIGSVLLLVALVYVQSPITLFLLPMPLLYSLRSAFLPLCVVFLVLAFIGKRSHVAWWSVCGLLCLASIGIDGGLHYTSGSLGVMQRPAFIFYNDIPRSPKLPSAEPLLAQGVGVYQQAHPNVPAALRVGNRFIVPRPTTIGLYGSDVNSVFRWRPKTAATKEIWNRLRERDLSPKQGWGEAARRTNIAQNEQDWQALKQKEATQPYRTVTTLEEAATRWRTDGSELLQTVRRENEDQHTRDRAYKAEYENAPPGFSFVAALTRCLPFVGVLGALVALEGLMAWLGRAAWQWLERARRSAR